MTNEITYVLLGREKNSPDETDSHESFDVEKTEKDGEWRSVKESYWRRVLSKHV